MLCLCDKLLHVAEGEDDGGPGGGDDELGAWRVLHGSQRLGHE